MWACLCVPCVCAGCVERLLIRPLRRPRLLLSADLRGTCAQHAAQAAFDHCKKLVKEAGLTGPGAVRVNKAGCLDRCAGGPVAVVYPEAVWYTYVDQQDIEEIVQVHLKGGQVVDRLVLPADVGR